MFGFLKNKLKEWVGKAKETIAGKEESAKEEIEEEKLEVKPEKGKKSKKQKVGERADNLIEKAKKKKLKEVPKEFSNVQESYQPDIEKIKQATQEDIRRTEEEAKKTQEIAEKIGKGKESVKQAVPELEKLREISEELFEDEEEEDDDNELEEPVEEKKSFFQRLKSSLSYKITQEDFDSIFEDLEFLLIENNVALEVVEHLKLSMSKKLVGNEIKKDNLEVEIKKELKSALNEILIEPDDPIDIIKMKKEKPFVILFFGINGTGKTTSIAKLAHLLKEKNLSVVLAAGDTFRAASIEQILEHANKLNVPLIKHDYGADPSAVGFDAIKYAKSHGIDVVLIDTAGRMHTKSNLLAEMEKIVRVTKPDLKLFVAESIAGNDAIEQAKTFNEAITIHGSILSKADVDEKGGTIISISYITKKPIFYLGTGQTYKDLKLFDKQEFIESLGL